MMAAPEPSPEPTGGTTALLEEVVERFELAWRRGERPAIDDYVPDGNLSVLVEVIHADLELRLETGETLRVETYLDRYPALANDTERAVELILAEFRLRRPREPGLTAADYLQRFTRFGDALHARMTSEASPYAPLRLKDPHATETPPHAARAVSQESPAPATSTGTGARYRPLRFHAKGGLGEVHVARDEELQRDVALKRLQQQFAADSESRRRFLREAEVTGRLEHPGIVPVYGMVQDADGQPCYAMRFIEGESLKDAIERFHKPGQRRRASDEQSQTLRRLLGRFVAVCNAISYGHSRGILHRDLKPGNIMLGKFGETLVVDWGLARPFTRSEAERASGEETLTPSVGTEGATQLGQAAGTPAYMSPEQAAGRWDVIGPASDVYSLGATLYALLTGQAPFLGKAEEVLRQVERGEVIPPRKVNREVDASLEAVCLKAIAHRPADRYATAQELAADVEHWLADEPVSACHEPLSLLIARWGRRHKLIVVGAVTVLACAVLAVAIGAYLISEQALRREKSAKVAAEVQRHEAERARLQEEQAKLAAEAQRREADQARRKAVAAQEQARLEAERAGRVSEFLAALFQVSDPTGLSGYAFRTNRERASKLTAGEILDLGAKKFASELKDQPVIQATLMDTIGNVYRSLGMYDKAAPLLRDALALREKVLGADDLDVAASLHNLGWLEHDRGNYPESEKLFRRALALRQQHLGDASLVTAATKFNLAWLLADRAKLEEAEHLFREVLALRQKQLGDGHRETTIALGGLAALLLDAGRYLEATPYIAKSLQNLRDHGGEEPVKAIGLYQKAVFERARRDYQAAERAIKECLVVLHQLGGEEHPFAAFVQFELGQMYEAQGDRKRAEAQYRIALAIGKNAVGLGHPKLMYPVTNLAWLLAQRKEYEEGKKLYLDVLAAQTARFGKDHTMRADTLTTFGEYVLQFGNRSEAEALLREASDIYRASKDDTPSQRDTALANLAWLHMLKQDYTNAERLYREAVPLVRKKYGARDGSVGLMLGNLAVTLLGQGKFRDAEPVLNEALAILRKDRRVSPQEQVITLERLVRLHRARAEYPQAAVRQQEALDLGRKLFDKNPARVAQLADHLAGALMDLEDYAAARPLFEEALTLTPQQKETENTLLASRLANLALNRLAAGDVAGYRALCKRLVADFGETKDDLTAATVRRVVGLAPDAPDQLPRVLQLSEDLVKRRPTDWGGLVNSAAVLYREGRFDDALGRLQEAVKKQDGQVAAYDGFMLALVSRRLGRTEAARKYFDQAVAAVARSAKDPAANDRLSWIDRLEHRLLRREAEAVLERPADAK
jgi:tetratricopeptide (TPR) repeat protein/tRNA A-37 threonylcarbamoyl transferase component Bud32